MLAIALEAGGDWPEAVRHAAIEIFRSQAAEDQHTGVQLLADIRSVFDAVPGTDKITSAELLEKLKEIETSPWGDWNKGKGLTPNGLSRLLKPFDVSPRTIRIEDRTPKGYLRESFEDAFSRYLVATPSLGEFAAATPPQPACLLIETDLCNRNTEVNVAGRKSASEPHKHCVVAGVAVQNPPREGVDTNQGDAETLPNSHSERSANAEKIEMLL